MHTKSFNEFVNESVNKFKIFQDLDGCLSDLDLSFSNLKENSEKLSLEEYTDKFGASKAWGLISKYGEPFWSEMPWMPDGKKLWNYVSKYKPTILTSPARDPKCYSGKIKWVQKNLGLGLDPNSIVIHNDVDWDPSKTEVILNSQKYKFCKDSNWILIDDNLEKLNKWKDAGGIAIHHTSAESTIEKLKKLGL